MWIMLVWLHTNICINYGEQLEFFTNFLFLLQTKTENKRPTCVYSLENWAKHFTLICVLSHYRLLVTKTGLDTYSLQQCRQWNEAFICILYFSSTLILWGIRIYSTAQLKASMLASQIQKFNFNIFTKAVGR